MTGDDPCKWRIESRTPNQCHESAPCPHLDEKDFKCPCLDRAREYEKARTAYEEAGAAAKQVQDTIKNVGTVK